MAASKTDNLTAQAYKHLRAEILSCRFAPGRKLVISELVAQSHFSLGAVREALSLAGVDLDSVRLLASADVKAHEPGLLGREGAMVEPPVLEVAPLVVRSVTRGRVARATTVGIPADLGALEQRTGGQVLHGADRALDLGDLLLCWNGIGPGHGLPTHGVDGVVNWQYYYRQSATDATQQATRREVRSGHGAAGASSSRQSLHLAARPHRADFPHIAGVISG